MPWHVRCGSGRHPFDGVVDGSVHTPQYEKSGLGMPIHPHMLRHSTGFKLANDGQATRAIQHYLGHRNIQHTVIYTQLASDRFNDFWKD
jgi:site-specific recombinase XerD